MPIFNPGGGGGGGGENLAATLAIGNSTGANDVSVAAGQKITTPAATPLTLRSGDRDYPMSAASGPALATTAQTLVEAINENQAAGGGGSDLATTLAAGNSTGANDIEFVDGQKIQGADGVGSGGGADLNLTAGAGGPSGNFNAGNVIINGGPGPGGLGGGGRLDFAAGDGVGTNGAGGAAELDAGIGKGTGNGGNLDLRSGAVTGSGKPGDVNIEAAGGGDGLSQIFFRTDGNSRWRVTPTGTLEAVDGGSGTTIQGDSNSFGGGDLTIKGGDAGAGSSGPGKDLNLLGGSGDGAGADGKVNIANGGNVTVNNIQAGEPAGDKSNGLILVDAGGTKIGTNTGPPIELGPVYYDPATGQKIRFGNSIFIDGDGVVNTVHSGDATEETSEVLETLGAADATVDVSSFPISDTPLTPGSVTIRVLLAGGTTYTEVTDDGVGGFASGAVFPAGGTIVYATGALTGTTATLEKTSKVTALYLIDDAAGEPLTVRSGDGVGTGDSGDLTLDAGPTDTGTEGDVIIGAVNASAVNLGRAAGDLGFHGATAVAKQTVTGSRGDGSALASLLTALATLGLITDSSTA